MAQIFEFPTAQSRGNSNAHTMSGVPGEVVIFPGIRYERAEDRGTAKSKRRPNTRRDTLEFEE